jgi:hypothetical protein
MMDCKSGFGFEVLKMEDHKEHGYCPLVCDAVTPEEV